MLSRRTVLAGIACLAASAGGVAGAPIGVRGTPALRPVLGSMAAVEEGAGPVLHVLVSPGCDKASDMWAVTRGLSMALTVRWLPVGFTEEETVAVAACLDAGDAESVRRLLLQPEGLGEPGEAAVDAAWRQARRYDNELAKMLWEATGRTPAMPTMVAEMPDGAARVIRGAIPADRAAEVLDLFY